MCVHADLTRYVVGATGRSVGQSQSGEDEAEYDILVWDVVYAAAEPRPMHVLRCHTMQVQELHPHPHDRRVVLSAGSDARAVIWDVVAGVCLREVCSYACVYTHEHMCQHSQWGSSCNFPA